MSNNKRMTKILFSTVNRRNTPNQSREHSRSNLPDKVNVKIKHWIK